MTDTHTTPAWGTTLACIVLVAVTVLGVSSLRAQPGVDAG